jgi:hypothetical protein
LTVSHSPIDPFSSDFVKDDRDPSAFSTVYVGVVGTILLVVIIYWLTAFYHDTVASENYAKQVAVRPVERERYRAAEAEALAGYGWVSQPDGVVRIPIERAMELVVAERQGQDP